jgi:TatD DNase family protein
MYLDFHTHQDHSANPNIRKIYNLDISKESILEDFDSFFLGKEIVSAGIHPWSVNEETIDAQLELLEALAVDNRVRLIGEIGLDKVKGPDFRLQEEFFLKQIRVAEAVRKPVVVHCVRSFNELIAIQKVIKPKVPMIIHGYSRKLDLASELYKKGFFLSFGEALLSSPQVQEVIKNIPMERIFLETDDEVDLDICEVYNSASRILGVSVEFLKDKIYQNYLELYL